MILAAGKGTRLRPLAERLPKPMLPIAGRPVLEHNIRLLASHGIRDVVINLHHRPEAITNYFGDGQAWGVSITYSYEPVLLGTAGAVKNMESCFAQTFLVLYGDNLTTCDLGSFIAFHRGKGGYATIALFYREDPLASGIVEVDSYDRILRFLEKPPPSAVFSHWVSAGLFVLEPEVLGYIPSEPPSDFGHHTFPAMLARGCPLYGYRMREGLWWIDKPADYQHVKSLANKGALPLP